MPAREQVRGCTPAVERVRHAKRPCCCSRACNACAHGAYRSASWSPAAALVCSRQSCVFHRQHALLAARLNVQQAARFLATVAMVREHPLVAVCTAVQAALQRRTRRRQRRWRCHMVLSTLHRSLARRGATCKRARPTQGKHTVAWRQAALRCPSAVRTRQPRRPAYTASGVKCEVEGATPAATTHLQGRSVATVPRHQLGTPALPTHYGEPRL